MRNTDRIWDLVDAKRAAFERLADRIWEIPEIAYTEYGSAAEHTAMLKRQVFSGTRECGRYPDRRGRRGRQRRAGDRDSRRI